MDPEVLFMIIFDRKLSIDELQAILPGIAFEQEEDWEAYYEEIFGSIDHDHFIDIPVWDYDKTMMAVSNHEAIKAKDFQWNAELAPATFCIQHFVYEAGYFYGEVFEAKDSEIKPVFQHFIENHELRVHQGSFLDNKVYDKKDIHDEPLQDMREKILGFNPFSLFDEDFEILHYNLTRKT